MTQTALAERVGVAQQTIQKWESDVAAPRHKRLLTVARELGVDVAYLAEEASGVRSSTEPEHVERESDRPLRPDELALLRKFRALSAADREALLRVARSMASRRQTKDEDQAAEG